MFTQTGGSKVQYHGRPSEGAAGCALEGTSNLLEQEKETKSKRKKEEKREKVFISLLSVWTYFVA